LKSFEIKMSKEISLRQLAEEENKNIPQKLGSVGIII